MHGVVGVKVGEVLIEQVDVLVVAVFGAAERTDVASDFLVEHVPYLVSDAAQDGRHAMIAAEHTGGVAFAETCAYKVLLMQTCLLVPVGVAWRGS